MSLPVQNLLLKPKTPVEPESPPSTPGPVVGTVIDPPGNRPLVVDRLPTGLLEGDGPLDAASARQITEMIRVTSDTLWSLLARAHSGRVWEPLGYATFREYVESEFDIGIRRAYQLLNQARVIEAICQAAPPGTRIEIGEPTARKIGKRVDEVARMVAEQTDGMDPEGAADVVDRVLKEPTRPESPSRSGWGPESGPVGFDEFDELDELDDAGEQLDPGWDNPHNPGAQSAGPAPDDGDGIDRRTRQSLWDLVSVLGIVAQLPDPETVAVAVPVDRGNEIRAMLPGVMDWLNRFAGHFDG